MKALLESGRCFREFWRALPLRWQGFLPLSLAIGALLRLLWLEDMEFKEDEHYDFIQSQLIGKNAPWPWEGMPSGVFIPNPGMSIWVFAWLARLSGAEDPVALMRALALVALAGIFLILPFCAFFLPKKPTERELMPWLWALVLSAVNPLEVYIQRKLWPEPFMPLFTLLFLMGFFRRERFGWALLWGLTGACLGQIHMSGFFFAFAIALWTLFFAKRLDPGHPVAWRGWLTGSLIGALPLLPWAYRIILRGISIPQGGAVSSGVGEALQLKFWVFWLSDGLGLHLGNPLGLLRGSSHWAQLSDFARYPLLHGQATWLTGAAHLGILALALFFAFFALRGLFKKTSAPPDRSSTRLALSAAFFGFGLVMTATGVVIRRYYMRISFPLEHLWLARVGLGSLPRAQTWLFALWLLQLIISASFVGYVHVNRGATQGDYGDAFHVIREQNLKTTGKPWAERPKDYGYGP